MVMWLRIQGPVQVGWEERKERHKWRKIGPKGEEQRSAVREHKEGQKWEWEGVKKNCD